jgi:hypothetical protein
MVAVKPNTSCLLKRVTRVEEEHSRALAMREDERMPQKIIQHTVELNFCSQ